MRPLRFYLAGGCEMRPHEKLILVSIGFSGGKPGGIDRRGVDQVPVLPVLSGSKNQKF